MTAATNQDINNNDDIIRNLEILKKELKEAEKVEAQRLKDHNIGYSTRCAVCNSPQLEKIEKLRENGETLENIKNALDLDFSIMSLQRHFKNHYSEKQKHKKKLQLLAIEKTKDLFIKYPGLKGFFINKDLEYLQDFIYKNGFCLNGLKLCPAIPPATLKDNKDIIKDSLDMLKNCIDNPYLYDDKAAYTSILLFNRCNSCYNLQLEKKIQILEQLFFKILDLKPTDDINLLSLYYLNDCDINKMLENFK